MTEKCPKCNCWHQDAGEAADCCAATSDGQPIAYCGACKTTIDAEAKRKHGAIKLGRRVTIDEDAGEVSIDLTGADTLAGGLQEALEEVGEAMKKESQ